MKTLFTLETVWSALRLAIPVAIAALGAIIGERAGVLNLGLEGMMLTGAFGGFVVADATGNSWVGMGAGPLTGAACGALDTRPDDAILVWPQSGYLKEILVRLRAQHRYLIQRQRLGGHRQGLGHAA